MEFKRELSDIRNNVISITLDDSDPLYNGQESGSQMNNLCTKQPLNKGHPYI